MILPPKTKGLKLTKNHPLKVSFLSQSTSRKSLIGNRRVLIAIFKGGDNRLKSLKRESMFVQLLEGLSAEEAELLVLCKDGKMGDKYKRITKAVVSEAFPSIEWGGRS